MSSSLPPGVPDLAGADRQFQSLADLMPQMVWTATPDGRIAYANGVWQAFCQAHATESGAAGFTESLHPDDLGRWAEAWQQALAGHDFEALARMRHAATGAWVPHLHHAVAMYDAQGRLVQWFGTSVNLEQSLPAHEGGGEWNDLMARLNEHLLGVLQERSAVLTQLELQTRHLGEIITTQSHLAQAELELEGFMLIVVERMLKLTPATGAVVEMVDGDEMVYRAASGTVRPYLGLRIRRAGSLSGLCVQERRMLDCPDTSIDPRVDSVACAKVGAASMVVTPLVDCGRLVGVLKILSRQPHAFGTADLQTLQLMSGLIGAAFSRQQQFDTNQRLLAERTRALEALALEVERRRRSEDILRASEARTRLIIDSSGEAFVGLNAAGLITDWNRQAALVFGWSAAEMLGWPLAQTVLPSGQQAAFADLLAAQAASEPDAVTRSELLLQTASGKLLPVEVTLSCIRSDGQMIYSAFLRDISQRRQQELRLRFQAEHDALTGLPNRRTFQARLESELEASPEHTCAVLFIDLDGFKAVNDSLGHEAGDALLRHVAQRLEHCIRGNDTLARLGGDEFVILLTDLPGERAAHRVAESVLATLAEPVDLDQGQAQIGASIGITVSPTDASADAGQLLREADAAMYQAKRSGKNRAVQWARG